MTYYGWTADFDGNWYNCERAWAKGIQHPTSINEDPEKNSFSIYPNPAGDFIQIDLIENLHPFTDVFVWNITGQRMAVLFVKGIGEVDFEADISTLGPGIYFIGVFQNNKLEIERFVKY